ncbi:MAG: PAS domain S-box protein [Desulfatibacillum sp.]|nr:PAS domain S-box protein [Desulfatibacillum sp.]
MPPKPTYEELESQVQQLKEKLSSNADILNETGRMARIGGWEHDLKTGKAIWTRALFDIIEIAGEVPPGPKEHLDFYLDKDRRILEQAVKRCMDKGDPFALEIQGRTGKDRLIWCRATGEAVYEDGQIVKMRGTFQDITSRKQVELALKASEQRYHAYLSNAPYGVFVADENGKYLEVNDEACVLTGYGEDELLALSISDLLLPESSEIGAEHFKQVVARGKAYGEFTYRKKDGEIRWWSVSASKISDTRFLGFVNDITDRKTMEQELRSRENLLSRVFDILPVGLWFADKNGQLLRGNPMGQKIWGAEPKVGLEEYGVFKARRMPSGEELKPEDWALAKTINEGATILDEMLEIDAFDGVKRTILNYTAPVLDNEGKVEAAVIVNLDITERQKAEEEKERLQKQLLHAQKMESVGRLAGGVAHDFNNMLGVIVGHAEMALDTLEPGSGIREDLTEILDAANRSANLTRQLLGFARKQVARPVVMDINEAIGAIMKMLRRLIGENIELAWYPGSGIWPVVMDPAQVDQILANLAVNVKDAISGVGRMTLSTYNVYLEKVNAGDAMDFVPGEYVLLEVSDNGEGMDQETLHLIFEPFFTTKGVGQGTGLGLATVYGIVRQNKGFIKVESAPGQGTTFRIYLPRTEMEKTKASPPKETPHPGTETILVVEDERAILSMCKAILARHGYKVLTAGSPREALELVTHLEGPLDLLISDVIMPQMNGGTLKKKILEMRPGLKHLFMSGYTADVIAHHGILERGVQYIQKPFAVNEFLNKTRKLLDEPNEPGETP